MKVYATSVAPNGDLVLIEWPSIKVFNAVESWCDERFIHINTAKELAEFRSEPFRRGMVIETSLRARSHNRLHAKYLELTA